ncbi:MAG: hypothetical protein V4671_03085 [Armatimonadota bacterium]
MLSFFAWMPGSVQAALPPLLEAKPLFGEKLVQGRWQPIVVTVANQENGDALTGEITTSLRDPLTTELLGSWIVPVTMPRGAGTSTATVTVFVPEREQPDLFISLQKGRDGRGDIVTRRTFGEQRYVDPSLTILAVTAQPDAIGYLRGEKLGVSNTTGVLRPAPDNKSVKPKNQNIQQSTAGASEVRVENLPDAGLLPGTATGYDTVGIVYLGPDIGPSQFSDSQILALRGWVAGGGLLVVASPTLRTDERFRIWLPVGRPSAVGSVATTNSHIGRGTVASVTGDLMEAGFARSTAALDFWRGLAREASAEPLAGNLIQGRGLNYFYSSESLWQSVIRAPGLKAPPASAIALFLLVYLLLLVPINYIILKRLDRREWTWATVPILVTLFSVGAYGFGYALKGTQMLQNTITLCEMGPNRGDAVVTASIGVFSPRQAKYDLSTPIKDASFWSPQNSGRYRQSAQEYGPLDVAMAGDTSRDSAVHIRNADISMWAMRVFAARSYQIKLGNGIAANLVQNGTELSGTVTNNTTRPLEQGTLTFGGGRTDIGSLAPGEKKTVRLLLPRRERARRNSYRARPTPDYSTYGGTREFQQPVMSSINAARESLRQTEQNQGTGNGGRNTALFSAWNKDEMFPIKIDGQTISTGTNLNLITTSLPVRNQ